MDTPAGPASVEVVPAQSRPTGLCGRRSSAAPRKMETAILRHCTLNIAEPLSDRTRYTKIVCTIGPASQSVEQLCGLMDAGLSVVRLNFSHGTHEYHGQTIANARAAAAKLSRYDVAIALDTKGAEIRTGRVTLPDGKFAIKAGQRLLLSSDPAHFTLCGTAAPAAADGGADDATLLYVDYPKLREAVGPGSRVAVEDGVLDLKVVAIAPKGVVCEAQSDHVMASQKGVNLPDVHVDLPAVSEKDRADLAFGATQKVDYVFASFIQSAAAVAEVRAALVAGCPTHGPIVQIIAKIENRAGVDNFDEILQAADGVMVARGDLGIEIPLEQVFTAQKMMISRANLAGKTVICATQMLESMTAKPRPTRAEVTDVANAVVDGADCVMLSGETANGKYPRECVGFMAQICVEAQRAVAPRGAADALRATLPVPLPTDEAVAASAVEMSFDLSARAIVVLSTTGNTARLVQKYRPLCPVVVATSNLITARQCALLRGTWPCIVNLTASTAAGRLERLRAATRLCEEWGILAKGDMVVAVYAAEGTKGFANIARVMVVE